MQIPFLVSVGLFVSGFTVAVGDIEHIPATDRIAVTLFKYILIEQVGKFTGILDAPDLLFGFIRITAEDRNRAAAEHSLPEREGCFLVGHFVEVDLLFNDVEETHTADEFGGGEEVTGKGDRQSENCPLLVRPNAIFNTIVCHNVTPSCYFVRG